MLVYLWFFFGKTFSVQVDFVILSTKQGSKCEKFGDPALGRFNVSALDTILSDLRTSHPLMLLNYSTREFLLPEVNSSSSSHTLSRYETDGVWTVYLSELFGSSVWMQPDSFTVLFDTTLEHFSLQLIGDLAREFDVPVFQSVANSSDTSRYPTIISWSESFCREYAFALAAVARRFSWRRMTIAVDIRKPGPSEETLTTSSRFLDAINHTMKMYPDSQLFVTEFDISDNNSVAKAVKQCFEQAAVTVLVYEQRSFRSFFKTVDSLMVAKKSHVFIVILLDRSEEDLILSISKEVGDLAHVLSNILFLSSTTSPLRQIVQSSLEVFSSSAKYLNGLTGRVFAEIYRASVQDPATAFWGFKPNGLHILQTQNSSSPFKVVLKFDVRNSTLFTDANCSEFWWHGFGYPTSAFPQTTVTQERAVPDESSNSRYYGSTAASVLCIIFAFGSVALSRLQRRKRLLKLNDRWWFMNGKRLVFAKNIQIARRRSVFVRQKYGVQCIVESYTSFDRLDNITAYTREPAPLSILMHNTPAMFRRRSVA